MVWEHFTQHMTPRPEDKQATYNHCEKSLASNPKMRETSTLRHHILNKCMKHLDRQEVADMTQTTLAFEAMKEEKIEMRQNQFLCNLVRRKLEKPSRSTL